MRKSEAEKGMSEKYIKYCGIKFWNRSTEELISELNQKGGLVVVPSAPALCSGSTDEAYLYAHRRADYAIVDSSYLSFLMACALRRNVSRISGLRLLQGIFSEADPMGMRARRILWVAPNEEEKLRILAFLAENGFSQDLQFFYTAPHYKTEQDFSDQVLLDLASKVRPEFIVLGIGGGKQEKLGYFLRHELGKGVPILCTGAALAFLTGGQVHIPTWADRAGLGWLVRTMSNPRSYGTRYLHAAALPWKLRQVSRSMHGIYQAKRLARRAT